MNPSMQSLFDALNMPRYVLRVHKPSTRKTSDVELSIVDSKLDPPDATMADVQVSHTGPPQDPDMLSIWTLLEQKVKTCQQCALAKTRTQTVFGSGYRQAKLMLIGEAPGMHEDRQGLPFVGRAGQLLTQMLAAIDIAREDVYIANMLKCRPPNNRDPKPEEVASCSDYLQQQVALVQPKLIVALGRIAAQGLLRVTTPLGRLRGQVHRYADATTPMLVTYHPAYLLRNPADKRKAMDDLLAIRSLLQ